MNKSILLGALSLTAISLQGAAPKHPNVIFIMTDDQGYGDVGCLGNPNIRTPNLDKLHAQSVRFTNFHSGTTSAPTRAGLMTGHNNNATGVWHTVLGRSLLDLEEVTLPSAFLHSGYATAIFGKWHLGDNDPYLPHDRGFQHSLIHLGGGITQSPDYWNNTYFNDVYLRNGVPEKQRGYCTDVWFSEAISFIEQNKEKPFFCCIMPNAPHVPLHIEERYAAPYRANDQVVSPEFYGMIANIDENMGALQHKLRELKLEQHTIVIFMTDNGTASGAELDKNEFVTKGYNAGMRGKKSSAYEGGHRVPFFFSMPGAKACDVNALAYYADFMPTLVDLCSLTTPRPIVYDGITLRPALEGKNLPERTLCVDTQRDEFLEKGKNSCVMTRRWRLINLSELYDIQADPEQRSDVAQKYPETVANLQAEYDKWWVRASVRADKYQYIPLFTDRCVTLNSMDLHAESNGQPIPAWNQNMLRKGHRSHGFWSIEILQDGRYTFDLMRWPAESGLPLSAAAPKGDPIPNGTPFPEGVSIPVNGARLAIGDKVLTQTIDNPGEKCSIQFEVTLAKGYYNLRAEFTEAGKKNFSAYYVVACKTE